MFTLKTQTVNESDNINVKKRCGVIILYFYAPETTENNSCLKDKKPQSSLVSLILICKLLGKPLSEQRKKVQEGSWK